MTLFIGSLLVLLAVAVAVIGFAIWANARLDAIEQVEREE